MDTVNPNACFREVCKRLALSKDTNTLAIHPLEAEAYKRLGFECQESRENTLTEFNAGHGYVILTNEQAKYLDEMGKRVEVCKRLGGERPMIAMDTWRKTASEGDTYPPNGKPILMYYADFTPPVMALWKIVDGEMRRIDASL